MRYSGSIQQGDDSRVIPCRDLACGWIGVKAAGTGRLHFRYGRQKLPPSCQIGCIRGAFLPIIGRRQTMTDLPPFGSPTATTAVQVSASGDHDKNEMMFGSRVCSPGII